MIVAIIPARYASTRFPGKPLIDIQGKSMIQRVFEQTSKAKKIDKVVVATDDTRIADHVRAFGGNVILTKSNHPTGTDRCFECLQLLDQHFDYVINVQGDEPLINPDQIDEVALHCTGDTELITQMSPITSNDLLFDEGKVKIVLNHNNEALYFSRLPIPCLRGVPQAEWHNRHNYYRHIGLYAYRKDILQQITELSPSYLEKAESLEQLRWLEAGYKIKCVLTRFDSHSIDTPDDVIQVLQLLNAKLH